MLLFGCNLYPTSLTLSQSVARTLAHRATAGERLLPLYPRCSDGSRREGPFASATFDLSFFVPSSASPSFAAALSSLPPDSLSLSLPFTGNSFVADEIRAVDACLLLRAADQEMQNERRRAERGTQIFIDFE